MEGVVKGQGGDGRGLRAVYGRRSRGERIVGKGRSEGREWK